MNKNSKKIAAAFVVLLAVAGIVYCAGVQKRKMPASGRDMAVESVTVYEIPYDELLSLQAGKYSQSKEQARQRLGSRDEVYGRKVEFIYSSGNEYRLVLGGYFAVKENEDGVLIAEQYTPYTGYLGKGASWQESQCYIASRNDDGVIINRSGHFVSGSKTGPTLDFSRKVIADMLRDIGEIALNG